MDLKSLFGRKKKSNSKAETDKPDVEREQIGGRLAADHPIVLAEEDVLARTTLARSFASRVLALDVRQGVVVGVLGPWGSGKTSFVNLARTRFDELGVPVLDFNPWMFSGADQLVASFFVEISAQLKVRKGLEDIGKGLEEYGDAFSGLDWIPVIGPWIQRGRALADFVGRMIQQRKEGVGERRKRVTKALSDLSRPIVIVLDDIDRLTSSEIRDIFKLVRLTANFPNIAYVLAFDRTRVEQALSEDGIPGRQYLEKIIQVGIDLPAIPSHVLHRQTLEAIEKAVAAIPNRGPFDETRWPDVFMEVISQLIETMRDVRRYVSTIRVRLFWNDGHLTSLRRGFEPRSASSGGFSSAYLEA